MTTPRCTHELPSAADGIEKRRLKQCWNLSSTHTADRFDRDMIPQLLPFRHAAFQITWAWRAPINFLIMTQKSSRSCKKRHERVGKGKKLCCCGVRFFFLFPLMSFSWPESLKGHKKKTSSRTMKRAFKKAIKLPARQ